MSNIQIATSFAAVLLHLYIAVSIYRFNVPESLSKTHYLWRGLGIRFPWFSVILSIVALIMVPTLLEASNEHDLQFLAFFTSSAMLFVAVTPNYLDDSEKFVHYGAALVSAMSSILATCLIFSDIELFFLFGSVIAIIAIATRTWNCWIFWLEMSCFYAIFLAILT